MRFSVVIPNLHTPVVGETLASLHAQQFSPARYEVIVVGMDKYDLVHPDSLVSFDLTECPLSPASARNRGAAQARGEILVFIDADCIAEPNWLAELDVRFFDVSVHVVGGGVTFDCDNYWTFVDNLSMFHDYLTTWPAGVRSQLPSLNLALRREVFMAVGGFDERYPRAAGEDADLTIRLCEMGYTLHFEPRASVRHRPPRYRWIDLWRHGFYQGKYSTKVDPRYADHEGIPWPLHTRLGVLVFAPLLAVVASSRILLKHRQWCFWRTAPVLLLAKLAWCAGAALRPNWGNH